MKSFDDLMAVVARLRAEDGCPWDREQTHMSLKAPCIEEAAEVICGINILEETGNADNLKEELGDLLLQVVMHAQIAEEEGLFTIDDVVEGITDKMIRRHPHVFGNTSVSGSAEVLKNWEEIKKTEKKDIALEQKYLGHAFDESIQLIETARKRKQDKWAKQKYNFYGWENATIPSITGAYEKIKTPRDLYDALSSIWCAESCAPRLRDSWTAENKTLGQCSITAFLAQDIFGGKVYGIPRSGGTFHCYNVVEDCVFDLTSEQFGDEKLDYTNNPEQFREEHFKKEEKRKRYEYLVTELKRRSLFI